MLYLFFIAPDSMIVRLTTIFLASFICILTEFLTSRAGRAKWGKFNFRRLAFLIESTVSIFAPFDFLTVHEGKLSLVYVEL